MPRSPRQTEKLLSLLDILFRDSDEDHPLSMADLLQKLEGQGISAERKSVYADLETLRQRGWDIQLDRRRGYWLAQRPFELAEDLHPFVSARVIDDGHRRPVEGERIQNGRDKMGGVDQVDVVCALFHQLPENLRETGGCDGFPEPIVADRGVLAEDTGQGAAGEENGSRTARPVRIPADTGFLAFMQGRPRHHGPIWHPAISSSFPRRSRRFTLAGTGRTDDIPHNTASFHREKPAAQPHSGSIFHGFHRECPGRESPLSHMGGGRSSLSLVREAGGYPEIIQLPFCDQGTPVLLSVSVIPAP